MTAAGVAFLEEPGDEAHGTVVVVQDVAGNTWDVLGPAGSTTGSTTSPNR